MFEQITEQAEQQVIQKISKENWIEKQYAPRPCQARQDWLGEAVEQDVGCWMENIWSVQLDVCQQEIWVHRFYELPSDLIGNKIRNVGSINMENIENIFEPLQAIRMKVILGNKAIKNMHIAES